MKVGVVIGRFQVPFLHEGHMHILDRATNKSDVLIVLIGCTRAEPDKRNPLDFMTRLRMVRTRYPNAMICPIYDQPDDQTWSRVLDSFLEPWTFGGGEVTLYGSRDCFKDSYHGRFPVETIEPVKSASGTEIRAKCVKDNYSPEFRTGIIYAINTARPRCYPTVDMAVVKGKTVLLGRKPNEQLWRLPGGFVDPADGSLAEAAQRELKEETGIECTAAELKYIGSFRSDDWRYQNEHRIMTTLFVLKLPDNSAITGIPGDDLNQISWMYIGPDGGSKGTYYDHAIVKSHVRLIEAVKNEIYNCSCQTS